MAAYARKGNGAHPIDRPPWEKGAFMNRCVIIGSADITDYDRIKKEVQWEDYFVYCDAGLRHIEGIGLDPDLIVGDFDSAEDPHMGVETIVLPREKDDTDTFYAVKEAVKRGYDDFLLVGVIGGRFDHSMGNISILLYLDSIGKKGKIIDDYSEMEIVSHEPVSIDESYSYFSLISLTGCGKGVNIKGAKYPLEDGLITCEYQYGISNEVLPGERASASSREGKLLLVKVF